jgi:predicted nucleic acid-binding protein
LDTSFLIAVEMAEHPNHVSARALMAKLVANGERLAMAPQVLAEFIHVATDDRRFERALKSDDARKVAQQWWTAREVEPIFPDQGAVRQYFEWLQTHRLGRKRQLDTLRAATYLSSGITSLLTLNSSDFAIFDGFRCLSGNEVMPS